MRENYYARHLRLTYFLLVNTDPAHPARAWSMSMHNELFHDGRYTIYTCTNTDANMIVHQMIMYTIQVKNNL